VWLLPFFSIFSRVVARVYYRLTYVGASVPSSGPALLVANHPNSLFDPVLVIAAAGRRIHFLAKAPLFTDRKVGWLVRGSGAIPVYRRTDDPDLVSRNQEMFRAVHSALAEGAAVAVFPEGISHSEPSLTPLKTGAARIALGFAQASRRALPIIPVGLVFRAKDVFRSQAQVSVGRPVAWDDLVGRDVGDADAVHELTARIERAMRALTVNLEAWEDAPLVGCALDVWEEARPERPSHLERIGRLGVTAEMLRSVRAGSDPDHQRLVGDVRRHSERLRSLGLAPQDLGRDTRAVAALRWSARRMAVLSVPAFVVAVAGLVVFWVPFSVTGRVAGALRPAVDQRATYKLLVGIPIYTVWVLLLAIGAGIGWGLPAFAGALVGLPTLGMLGLRVRERWRGARDDVLSFMRLRSQRELVSELRTRQDELAAALDAVYQGHPSRETPS